MSLIGILSIFLFSSGISAETSEWRLKQNEHSASIQAMGTAEINDLRTDAILKCDCNKNGAFLRLEIADFPLNNSNQAIAALAAACPNFKPQPRKPAMGK
jgi:hypothetical protein